MDIKSILNNNSIYIQKDLPQKGKDQNGNTNLKIQDKLELSQEAKTIQNSTNNIPRSDEIKERIQDKFYDSDDVVSKVADKILNEIKNTK